MTQRAPYRAELPQGPVNDILGWFLSWMIESLDREARRLGVTSDADRGGPDLVAASEFAAALRHPGVSVAGAPVAVTTSSGSPAHIPIG
jgi:hypothetical protein